MFRSPIFSFFPRSRGQSANRTRNWCVPTLEALEDRLVPSTTTVAAPVSVAGSHLAVASLVATPNGPSFNATNTLANVTQTLPAPAVTSSPTSVTSPGIVNLTQIATATAPAARVRTIPSLFDVAFTQNSPVLAQFNLALVGGGGEEPDYGFESPVRP